jgi:hypothetical protein
MKNAALRLIPLLIMLAVLPGCSSNKPQQPPSQAEQPAVKPQPQPTEQASGREAFQRLFVAARGWTGDARPFRLQSSTTSDSDGHNGKAAIWSAAFASPARRVMEGFSWSGSSAEGAPERGISHGTEDSWTPANSTTQPFDISFLKTDSDKAFDTAQKHGGARMLRSKPKTPVSYRLDWDAQKNQLVWHVSYGDNLSRTVIDVNATSGEYLRTEK